MQATIELPSSVDLAPAIAKLTKDEKSAARLMTARQARYIVDSYYQQQENRKRGDNQVSSMEEAGEPHALAAYLAGSYDAIEARIQSILDHYSDAQPAGRWARSIVGIGPVIAAGLLAHIDIERSVTVGDIYSFAGLNPSRKWEAKTKRPWNARLKTLCCHPAATVDTSRGIIPIKDVRVGDEVLTHKGRMRRVTKVIRSHYEGEVVRVRAVGFSQLGPILTSNHPVYVQKRRVSRVVREGTRVGVASEDHATRTLHEDVVAEIRAMLASGLTGAQVSRNTGVNQGTISYIKNGKYSPVQPCGNPVAWEDAGTLRAGDLIKAPTLPLDGPAPILRLRRFAHPHNPPSSYEVTVDPDVARLIGLYLGDGHASRNATLWSFGAHEVECAEFVVATLRSKFGLPASIQSKNNMQVVRCGSKALAECLVRTFGKLAHGRRIPDEYLRAPSPVVSGLVRGLIESDGYVSETQASFSSVNRNLATSVWRMLHSLGVSSAITPTTTTTYPPNRTTPHVCPHYQVTIGDLTNLNRAVFGVEVAGPKSTTAAKRDATGTWHTIREPHRFDYSGDVYNLEVEEDRSYTVGGIAVHNCYKIGASFTKVCNHEDDVYGKIYQKRKAYEWEKNLNGDYAEQARQKLADFNIGEDTDARAWYEGRLTAKQAQEILNAPAASKLGLAKKLSGNPGSGVPMLPPAHVQQRCERYAAKMFLSGFHSVSYFLHFGKLPPVPYAFAKDTGSPHAHYFYVPNSHLVPGLREAEEAQYR